MIRKPTYAGNVKEKDDLDIIHWAIDKTASERLAESWKLNCMNHNIPIKSQIDKTISLAHKRNSDE